MAEYLKPWLMWLKIPSVTERHKNDSDFNHVIIDIIINSEVLLVPKRSNPKTVEKEAIRNQNQDKDSLPSRRFASCYLI
ncbi:predicted protein [Botrytis cinerea T4]|uniref:Uncharacterized protein n=1 Tax=Botryotinia fuckeliana (strain T4) TaxID=999810 RepID=G2XXD3_BOTF4|nr:predicted protein [Botrytis cinerea T4]